MQEKWKDYYSKEQLQKVQEIELENLKVFIEICKKLKVDYVLYGGSLLGQVKYKGFIPWDDDIDVALPRKSYERFVRYAPKLLPENYFIQTPYNCATSPYPYTKLRRKGTQYVEYVHRNLRMETGIYMDIYPIDRIPDNEMERKKQFKRVRRWIFIYVCRQSRLYEKKEQGAKGVIKNFTRFIVCKILKIIPKEYCVKRIDLYMTQYNDTNNKRYSALNSPNYENTYDQLYPLLKGEFCGLEVCIPNDYLNHLYRRYGDFSKTPPKGDMVGHIPYILDLGEHEN